MEKLKPCPFCGGEAKIMKMGYPHWIYCLECGAKVHGGTTSEKDSIKAWNRRAEPKRTVRRIHGMALEALAKMERSEE